MTIEMEIHAAQLKERIKMKEKIKVRIEYLGSVLGRTESHSYKILKIDGQPTVDVLGKSGAEPARVGDTISEKQAWDLSERVTLETYTKKG